ncbi:MAG: Na+/H+ antiporter subunit D, partial [Candidatus Omnitrophica bacterium]|nr:Na+/H+ antiporter subunit D [Candidatus Omnitrophota bacterium]
LLTVAFAGRLFFMAESGEVSVLRVGGWPESYGIVLVLDRLSALMILLATLVQATTLWFACSGILEEEEERNFFHPLFLILCGSVNWTFLTGDLFNLFVAFEILLISSYVLLFLRPDKFSFHEAIRFVALNALGGILFLASAGLTFGRYGTLNFADLALRVRLEETSWDSAGLAILLLTVFGLKAALFPFFFWLPDAYPRISPAILPYFAGLLTKVGVYCLYRVFTLVFGDALDSWLSPWILAIAGGTMLVGVFGALSRWTFRKILSFHIISQIGYMIFGLGLHSVLGLACGIFYLVHHILVKSTLFLIAGHVVSVNGRDDLKGLGGLARSQPIAASFFLLTALSLAGIPPLSGFYGKFGLVLEGLSMGHIWVVAVSIVTSLLTLASMLKIWNYAFWGKPSHIDGDQGRGSGTLFPIGTMVFLSLAVAVGSGPLMGFAEETGRQLLDGRTYIEAVLGTEAGLHFEQLNKAKGQ